MHVVYKSASTEVRESATGVSFNYTLLVGPTVHASLLDVMNRFRSYRAPLITDVSKMYRAVELTIDDLKTIHTFADIWYRDVKSFDLIYGDHLFNEKL